jgi:hypothetical protein
VPRQSGVILVVLMCLVAGCGSENGPAPPPSREATQAAEPAWARTPAGAGEIVVRGEASPGSHGPFAFNGRYTVRFVQVAPENPRLDFTKETSFVARLDRNAELPGASSLRLFRMARGEGARRVRVSGRYFVDVEFGDYPYVIRFTPAK